MIYFGRGDVSAETKASAWHLGSVMACVIEGEARPISKLAGAKHNYFAAGAFPVFAYAHMRVSRTDLIRLCRTALCCKAQDSCPWATIWTSKDEKQVLRVGLVRNCVL